MYYNYKRLFGEDWEPTLSQCDYILRYTGSVSYTSAQLFAKLISGLSDYIDLLGYYPNKHDIVEVDNGLDPVFLYLNQSYHWEKLYDFDKAKCDDGSVGGFSVTPQEYDEAERFTHTSVDYEQNGIGCMRGYFAEGRFQSLWRDNRQELAAPGMWGQFEKLVETLKKDGFLRGLDEMREYCHRFPRGAFLDCPKEYGYIVESGGNRFYIRCRPDAEDYQVYVYVYACFS
jgi:hypothetical protein